MKTNRIWMLAAAVGLAAWSGAAVRGQNALDNAPGEDTKRPAPAKTEGNGNVKPAEDPEAGRPAMPDIISPDASKQLDDQDLTNKLTGKANTGSETGGDPKQKMTEIMDRMGQSQTRLSKEKDPGVMTQEMQSRIVIDIDAMIELLKQQQQQQSSSKTDPNSKPGEQKQESQQQSQGSQQQSGNQAATSDPLPGGSASAPQTNGTNMHEEKRGWGDLPPRDRYLVANGAKEKYLPEYSDMIQRYYEALAELGKSAKER